MGMGAGEYLFKLTLIGKRNVSQLTIGYYCDLLPINSLSQDSVRQLKLR